MKAPSKPSPQGEGLSPAETRDQVIPPLEGQREAVKTIICHAFPAWDAPYIKSTVELMTRLAKDNRVIYFDYHYTWKDVFKSAFCPKKAVLGLSSRWRKEETPHGTVEIYSTPPILPVNWINNRTLFRLVGSINGWLIRRHVRKVLKTTNPAETVLVNALNPVFGMLTDKAWKVSKKVYYCYDELKGTPWSNKWGPEYEAKYLKTIDQVVCTSTRLAEDKGQINPNCAVVKNGVNLALFKELKLEKTVSGGIGYIGAVDSRIDFNLVQQLAQQFQQYHFYFFGPVKVDLPKDMPQNIYFFGERPQEELPKLIEGMEACIIPFVKNELTAAIYPLKINEYLAMGKPVITTHFGDLSDFEKIISIADSPEEFANAIRREVQGNSRLRIQKRLDFAKGNSWEERTASFNVILNKVLNEDLQTS